MIVRIMGEGQYDVPDGELGQLETLDEGLNKAIEAGDEEGVDKALGALVAAVRRAGAPVGPSTIVPSDLTVPHEHSTLDDILELLGSEPEADPVAEGA